VYEELAIEAQSRDDGVLEDRPPVRPGEEGRADVGEEGERQPPEDVTNQPVRAPDLQGQDGEPDGADEGRDGDGHQQVHRRRDRPDVGAGVDSLGGHEAQDHRVEQLP
jgi:hypothetical protein